MDEKVLRLDITVNNILAMAVLDGFQQLVDVLTDKNFIDAIGVLLENLEQILLQVLEDEVQTVASTRNEDEKANG